MQQKKIIYLVVTLILTSCTSGNNGAGLANNSQYYCGYKAFDENSYLYCKSNSSFTESFNCQGQATFNDIAVETCKLLPNSTQEFGEAQSMQYCIEKLSWISDGLCKSSQFFEGAGICNSQFEKLSISSNCTN